MHEIMQCFTREREREKYCLILMIYQFLFETMAGAFESIGFDGNAFAPVCCWCLCLQQRAVQEQTRAVSNRSCRLNCSVMMISFWPEKQRGIVIIRQ